MQLFSVKSERSCLDRCKTKQLYANICTNEVKKIRELKSKDSSNGSNASSNQLRNAEVAKQKEFHDALAKYRISSVSVRPALKNIHLFLVG